MKITRNILLLVASIVLPATSGQFSPPEDDCENKTFSVSPVSGLPWTHGDGDTYFCDTKWQGGLVICGIQTWASKYHQQGFRVKYSDGTWGSVHGKAMQEYESNNWTGDYTKNTLEWDCAAPLKDLRMISNWPGFSKHKDEGVSDAVGGIRLTTPDGTGYFIHSDIGNFPGEIFDHGSGFLVAARGRSGDFLDTLEWRMLASPVKSAEIKSLKFKQDLATLNKRKDKVEELELNNVWFINRTADDRATYEFGVKQEKKVTTAIIHSITHQFGVNIGLSVESSVKIPLLTKAEATASFETSYSYQAAETNALTNEETISNHWTRRGYLAPNSALYCKAYTFKGRYEDEYEATVAITFKSGKSIDVKQPGKFVSVGWTEAVVDCQEKTLEEAPSNAEDRTPVSKGDVKMLKARAVGSY